MIKLIAMSLMLVCSGIWSGMNLYAEDLQPCAYDIAKLCKNTADKGGNIVRCLKEHEKNLLPECREKTEAVQVMAGKVHKACADDIFARCSNVRTGRIGIMRCLNNHKNELSPECGIGLKSIKRRID